MKWEAWYGLPGGRRWSSVTEIRSPGEMAYELGAEECESKPWGHLHSWQRKIGHEVAASLVCSRGTEETNHWGQRGEKEVGRQYYKLLWRYASAFSWKIHPPNSKHGFSFPRIILRGSYVRSTFQKNIRNEIINTLGWEMWKGIRGKKSMKHYAKVLKCSRQRCSMYTT